MMAGLQAPTSSGLQGYIASGLQVRVGGGGGSPLAVAVWFVTNTPNLVGELDSAAVGTIIRAIVVPVRAVSGIGGKGDVIWNSRLNVPGDPVTDVIDERSVVDLSIVRTGSPSFLAGVQGVGGNSSVIWMQEQTGGIGSGTVRELSVVDFSIVRSGASQADVMGCGGNSNLIWMYERIGPNLYEISPVDFSVVVTAAIGPFPNALGTGAGGNDDELWTSDLRDRHNRLVPGFAIISTGSVSPPQIHTGIGGG